MAKEAVHDNSYGVVAFIFGVLSILFAPSLFLLMFYGPIIGPIFGILGIIFAIKQKKVHNNKWANWGLVMSIIGIVLNAVVIFIFIKLIGAELVKIQDQLNAAQAAVPK